MTNQHLYCSRKLAQRAAEPEGLERKRVGAASRHAGAAVKTGRAAKRKSLGGRLVRAS